MSTSSPAPSSRPPYIRPRPMVVLSVRAYCPATPPWYAAAAVRTAVLALDAREQRALGVDAELVAVAGDRGVEDLGVRREDERRELRQRRDRAGTAPAPSPSPAGRTPVQRSRLAVRSAARRGSLVPASCAGVSSASQPASSAAAPPARPAPSTARRDVRVTRPSWRRVVGWRHEREWVDTRL